MIRRVLAMAALFGLGLVGFLQTQGNARVVTWEFVVLAGAVAVVVGTAERHHEAPPLWRLRSELSREPPGPLTALEVEVAAAVDPTLVGDRPLRRRLLGLLTHRLNETDPERAGREAVGEEVWGVLTDEGRPMTLEQIHQALERIEQS